MEANIREREAAVLPDFDAFFRDTFGAVARAAALVARDPGVGQELAQEAFFRLYERWPRIQSAEHARRFAFRVAINLARSHLRKHLRVALAGLEPRAAGPDPVTRADEWLAIRSALEGLTPRRRAAVVLVDYVGMDAAETGEVLGISAGAVRALVMRGRRDLRSRLGTEDREVPG